MSKPVFCPLCGGPATAFNHEPEEYGYWSWFQTCPQEDHVILVTAQHVFHHEPDDDDGDGRDRGREPSGPPEGPG